MTRRQLSALFEETLAGEPPLRDLVGAAVARGRAERRRSFVVAAAGLATAAAVALVVLPSHGPWRSALDDTGPADEAPAVTLPDRFLPVPQVPDDAAPIGATREAVAAAKDEPWAGLDVDPYDYTDGEGGSIWTGTTFADAVGRLVQDKGGRHSGVPLGFDGPILASLDGTTPARWVETWQADQAGVTGIWVQQWTLWPRVWQYCTDQDAQCSSHSSDGITVVSSQVRVNDVVTHRPVQTWVARASTAKDLMIVVVAGPRTRAGVSTGSSRPEPLLDRAGVEDLARRVAELGY